MTDALTVRTAYSHLFQSLYSRNCSSFTFVYQEGCFQYKKEKSQQQHWIRHIRITLGTKFQLKLTILIFLARFSKKGNFQSKTEKWHLRVRPWSLLTILNFPNGGWQTQCYFNVSSSSSRRDNYYKALKVNKPVYIA